MPSDVLLQTCSDLQLELSLAVSYCLCQLEGWFGRNLSVLAMNRTESIRGVHYGGSVEGVVTHRNESGRQSRLKSRCESVSEYVLNQHNYRSTLKTPLLQD